MAGTDNHRNSGRRRVNMKIWGGVPSFNRNLSSHQLSCLLVLRLLSSCLQEEEEEDMDKMGKTFLGIIFTFGALLLRFLVTREVCFRNYMVSFFISDMSSSCNLSNLPSSI